MTALEPAVALSADHIAMLRAVDQAGGSMALSKLVEVLTPGAMTAPKASFGREAIRGARVAGELRRWGMLERQPFTTHREITPAGRAALAHHVEGSDA